MTPTVFDDRACTLGEGALWHPARGMFVWFDITAGQLLGREDGQPRNWPLGRMASAAGWIDADRLMIATERGLAVLSLGSGRLEDLAPVEADSADTRSNDGRADRQGGFWFSTMSKTGAEGAGAIYRWYRGTVRCLRRGLTTPNTITFTADGGHAIYSDTRARTVWRQPLDADGWPQGDPEVLLDLAAAGERPDGGLLDRDGNLWIALYGAGAVVCHAPDGRRLARHALPAQQPTCPAFGGPDLRQLIVTTARQNLDSPDPAQGQTFSFNPGAAGIPEPQVIL